MRVHLLPGRVRFRVPGLRRNPALAARVERQLGAQPGIRSVAASPLTGTILIRYHPQVVSLEQVELLVEGSHQLETAATAEPTHALPPGAAAPASGLDATSSGDAAPGGLSTAEATRRLAAHGPNALREPPRPSFLARFLQQYTDVMQLTLAAGAGLSYLTGHRRDGQTIAGVLLLNGLIGATQTPDAARSVAALRGLTERTARVRRDGCDQEIPAAALVPGDLLLLAAGDRTPADATLITGAGLAVDESLLTGESAAVEKGPGSGLYAGAAVVRGHGTALVTATGMDSALGRVAQMLVRAERPSPLREELDGLGRRIARVGFWLAGGAVGLGLLRGQGAASALLSGVSLAISALPEGLPTFVTLALAAGARQVTTHGAAVQDLGAVETMGAVTTLCFDKTGTLTQGEMTVREILLPDSGWEITGGGFSPEGEFRCGGVPRDPLANPSMRRLLKVAALCTSARIGVDRQGALITHGDPTEIALLTAALKAGLRACGGEGVRLLEVPFDANRRRMAVVCQDGDGQAVACVKGAPEAVLPLCTQLWSGSAARRLTEKMRKRLGRSSDAMAARGLRVLAVAYRPVSTTADQADTDRSLILLGLIGLTDPPRPDAAATITGCRAAGIKVLMLTGDHPATALSLAHQVGLPAPPAAVVTGDTLDTLSDQALAAAVERTQIVARLRPEQKVRIVETLRQAGHTVAMVGDGVNDAPAMRAAHVSLAMGGTDVARAAASLVLESDRLETILDAIKQGRTTRGNISRTARYLLGSNTAEISLMAASMLLGLPLPLLPVQLLWMNLVSGLPASALGSEPPEPGLMQRAPGRPGAVLGPQGERHVLGHGLRTGAAATGLYALALLAGRPLAQARTIALATLTAGQIRHLFACRSPSGSQQVRIAGTAAAVLGLSSIFLPPLRGALQLAPLGPGALALTTGVGVMAGARAPGR